MISSMDAFMQSLKFLPKEEGRSKLERFYKSTTKKLGLEYIMITDDEIKAKDFTKAHKFFSKLDKSWRAYKGKVMLNIDGYNHVKEELFEIPEVVEFFKELYLTHPHYLFYLDVPTESFKLAVRFLADKVIMQDLQQDMSELYEDLIAQMGHPEFIKEHIDEIALFHSSMATEVFNTLTVGLVEWFSAKNELSLAYDLLKNISKEVELYK